MFLIQNLIHRPLIFFSTWHYLFEYFEVQWKNSTTLGIYYLLTINPDLHNQIKTNMIWKISKILAQLVVY